MDVLKKIRTLMDERGWSEYHLAKVSGITQSTINSMFRKNNMPTIPTLENICKAFGITLSEFFADSTSPIELTREQQELLGKWSALSYEQKEVLYKLIGIM